MSKNKGHLDLLKTGSILKAKTKPKPAKTTIYWSILGQNRPKPAKMTGHFWSDQKWSKNGHFWSFGHNMVGLNFWSVLAALAVWPRFLGQNRSFLADFGLGHFWSVLAGNSRRLWGSGQNRPKMAGQILLAKCQQNWQGQNWPFWAKTSQNLASVGWFWTAWLAGVLRPAPSLGPHLELNSSRQGWSSTVQCLAWTAELDRHCTVLSLASWANQALYSAGLGQAELVQHCTVAGLAGRDTAPRLFGPRRSEWSDQTKTGQNQPCARPFKKPKPTKNRRKQRRWGLFKQSTGLLFKQHSSIDHSMVI